MVSHYTDQKIISSGKIKMEQQSQRQKPLTEKWQYDKLNEQSRKYYNLGYNTGFCGCCIDEELESDPDYVAGWEDAMLDRKDMYNK